MTVSSKIATKINLRACNFQSFPGGHAPQSPLALAYALHAGCASHNIIGIKAILDQTLVGYVIENVFGPHSIKHFPTPMLKDHMTI